MQRFEPDATTPNLTRCVLVANQKGGVGKSSVVTAVAVMAARAGRVLVVDADQQANATVSDLGASGDRGRSLAMALQFAAPLEPVREVRPGVDLVPGGPLLAAVGASASTAGQTGMDLRANLAQSLGELCRQEQYALVLIDSGPGDAPLLEALLGVARYLVVPTRDDDASLSGVEMLAARYLRARQAGAAIELLGVVLFDANPRATARNRAVLAEVESLLEGSGAQLFDAVVRTDRAAAVDLRARHLTPGELVVAVEEQSQSRFVALRAGLPRTSDADRLWSRDPSGLAGDYQSLTRELLTRLAASERSGEPVR